MRASGNDDREIVGSESFNEAFAVAVADTESTAHLLDVFSDALSAVGAPDSEFFFATFHDFFGHVELVSTIMLFAASGYIGFSDVGKLSGEPWIASPRFEERCSRSDVAYSERTLQFEFFVGRNEPGRRGSRSFGVVVVSTLV